MRVAEEYKDKYKGICNVFPDKYQFTYYDYEKSEVGFVDCKNNIKFTATYISNDIHDIFFYMNKLVIVGCYSIEVVSKNGIKTLMHSRETCEFQKSIFISPKNKIVMLERYWRGSVNKVSLCSYLLMIINSCSLTQIEKDKWLLFTYLKDNPNDTNAWLRLTLMEYYYDDRLIGRWLDRLHLYDREITYMLYCFLLTQIRME